MFNYFWLFVEYFSIITDALFLKLKLYLSIYIMKYFQLNKHDVNSCLFFFSNIFGVGVFGVASTFTSTGLIYGYYYYFIFSYNERN